MTQTPRIVYRARDDVTPQAEASVLAAVYKLCLERSHARKRGRLPDKSGPDGTKTKEVSANEHHSK